MSTIIFTHYGVSEYLNTTMPFVDVNNSNIRKIFIGDRKNKYLAEKYNWMFYDIDSICDEMVLEFESVFKTVSGIKHKDIKNGRNWTKYVFLRWFAIRYLIEKYKIKSFWHFDSDTLVLSNLSLLEQHFKNNITMMQCNSMCLNGFINSNIVNEYCKSIINQFKDNQLLKSYIEEFKNQPYYAFTEMRAFVNYKKNSNRKFVSGMDLNKEFVFDDCLCQSHGFNTYNLPEFRNVKEIYFKEGRCYFLKDNKVIRTHTLNLSWLSNQTIKVIKNNILESKTIKLSNSKFPSYLYLIGALRRMKRFLC